MDAKWALSCKFVTSTKYVFNPGLSVDSKLVSLFRPAFMDEYERLEEELQECYESYMVKFRCLAYLERLLEEHEFAEKQKMEVCLEVDTTYLVKA